MADIAEAAEKKLKSRIRKLKKCNKDEEEKEKFFNQLGLSFTISLPNKNPEKQDDMITNLTKANEEIVKSNKTNIISLKLQNEKYQEIIDKFTKTN